MIRTDEIASLVVDGVEVSAIKLGTKDGGMPNHLFQGEKTDGMIIRGGKAEKWIWTSIHYEGNQRYVYFPKIELHSLEEIATTRRANALNIVRNIAAGLNMADREWLNLETGVFPLYRIFIVNEEDVLLLPPDIGDVIGLLRSTEQRRDEVNVLIKKDTEPAFLLISEMVQLLYYALTGSLPYIDEEVRHWKYREFPLESALETIGETADQKTLGFINFVLHAKSRQMRDIGGNRQSSEALRWFLQHSAGLEWTSGNRETVSDFRKSPLYASWNEKTEKGAKKNTFWRKKGTIITTCTIIGIAVVSLVGSWIARVLEPPVTRDLSQEEIVQAVYVGQNTLDPELLGAAEKGTALPQETEVINLFVSSKMRGAYEMISPIHSPDQWIADGCPAIPQGDLIYGVTDIELERTGENTIVAKGKWYGPYYGEEEEKFDPMTAPEAIRIQVTEVEQSFVFEWNDRGWWNIVESAILSDTPLEVLEVPLIPGINQAPAKK